MSSQRQPRIAIIGAGMSGICIGALLLEAGIDTFTILEKTGETGGTWRENTYPASPATSPRASTSTPSRATPTGAA